MNDSVYLINIQVDNTDEVIQVLAMNKIELQRVISTVSESESLISAVQSLGNIELAKDFIDRTNEENSLEFGGCQGDV